MTPSRGRSRAVGTKIVAVGSASNEYDLVCEVQGSSKTDPKKPNGGRIDLYLPTLDGWRAIAIAGVILSHYKETFHSLGIRDETFLYVASHGRLGVSLFFAISGFLICSRLLHEQVSNGQISLTQFYLRRSFRILPLYYFYLLTLVLLWLFAGVAIGRDEMVACLFFFRNYSVIPDNNYTGHFWSLAVEEHFYLLWPMMLVFIGKRRLLWLVPVLAIGIHIWRSLDAKYELFASVFPDHGFIHRTDTRLDALLWGCFAAMLCFGKSNLRLPSWVAYSSITLLVLSHLYAWPALPLIIAILFPILLLGTVYCKDSILASMLEWSWLRWIGRLSYSLYIWQTLFLQYSFEPDPAWLAAVKHWPTNLVMILVMSVFTHYWIEQPMIRWGRVLAKRMSQTKPTALAGTATS